MAKDVLFEIGLEELPARFIDDAEMQLKEKTESWLKELRVAFETITTYSTPRRLAILIQGLAEEQTTVEEEAKGPALKIAQDADGNWTKAAIGFTKGQGKTTADIYTKEIKGISYIFVNKRIEGKPSFQLLTQFKEIIESLSFAKNMKWGVEKIRYARPIRWLVALYGDEVIPFEIASVTTSNITYGHRFLGKEMVIHHPVDYEKILEEQHVIVNPKRRETIILNEINAIEAREGYTIPIDQALLDEVRNLVEYPTVFVGQFDKQFLTLPSEVLITSMKEHQRYFPVKSKTGELLHYFIGVRNGDSFALDKVVKGNEKVLRARLSDAQFFFDEDKQHSINDYLAKLKQVVFQKDLGTIHDKVQRTSNIAKHLANLLHLDAKQTEKVVRAAEISKYDLVTNMVNEFTELQGIMGEKYALHFNEDEDVARAIAEQYLPKQSNGALPETLVGAVLSLSDKLDTITGCIYVGLRPSGSQDPYGLRRQAIGILRILLAQDWKISLEELLRIPITLYEASSIKGTPDFEKELNDFMRQRMDFILKEEAIEVDVIAAVTKNAVGNVAYTIEKAKILSEKRNDPRFKPTQEGLVRVLNLMETKENREVKAELFQTESEAALSQALQNVTKAFAKANAAFDAEEALNQLATLAEPIHHFFNENMVMAKEEAIRNNRLALLTNIGSLILNFADLSAIEWKQHF
ncbi:MULTISPECIES: glycine--tRNA ligase subunit beta [unclassified Virgibacillus]|uniref:glycine--tRNA ligase subunit beta n=1 Tax=unclassified Virgibacillus TaxID=2620237 RepID=UPI0024DEBE6E|nr:glycine--tRNA ligase subunit beta [Virgibacillus sp. LDC-1]